MWTWWTWSQQYLSSTDFLKILKTSLDLAKTLFNYFIAACAKLRQQHIPDGKANAKHNNQLSLICLSGVSRHSTKYATGNSQWRNVRSKFWWLTRFCDSHHVSHFAAFFIVVGAETSIAESCMIIGNTIFTKANIELLIQYNIKVYHWRLVM